MPSIISAGTTVGTSLSLTGDTSGELQIKTNNGATTALTLTTGGTAVFTAGTVSAPAITTTGDTNTGIFFPAADTIAFTEGGVESMRIDSSGNVGIGTSSPDAKLTIETLTDLTAVRIKASNSTASLLTFGIGLLATGTPAVRGSGNGLNVGTSDVSPLQFYTNAIERMRVTSTGSVLINTTSAVYNLTVGDNTKTVSQIGAYSIDSSYSELISRTETTAFSLIANGTSGGAVRGVPASTVGFGTNQNVAIVFANNATERMRIESGGNVKIGNGAASASARLMVNVTSGSAAGIQLFQDGNESWIISNPASSTALTFANSNVERMRITAAGDVLVGNTQADPTAGAGVKIFTNSIGVSVVNAASTNSDVAYRLYSLGAAAYRFYVGYAGTVFATNTTISAISDQRLKENIQDIDVGLDAVMALKPRKFDWKVGKGKNTKGDRGWIAQEFEQVFPEMINDWLDPAPDGEEPYKSVAADLIPVLVKAIQELKATVDAQAARIAALESN
jgi:hypothetical protein